MVGVGKKNLVNYLGLADGTKNEDSRQEKPDMEWVSTFFQNFLFSCDETVKLSDGPE